VIDRNASKGGTSVIAPQLARPELPQKMSIVRQTLHFSPLFGRSPRHTRKKSARVKCCERRRSIAFIGSMRSRGRSKFRNVQQLDDRFHETCIMELIG
jgi:hypothetical protein